MDPFTSMQVGAIADCAHPRAGAPSSAIIKRGRCMYHAAAELADLGIGGEGGTALDAAARAFQRRALDEAPSLMKHSVEAVQLEAMRCVWLLHPYVSSFLP